MKATQVEAQIYSKTHVSVDSLSRRGTVYTAKQGYFYRFGNSEDKIVEAVKATFPNAIILEAEDCFHSWPTQSYFMVKFELPSTSL